MKMIQFNSRGCCDGAKGEKSRPTVKGSAARRDQKLLLLFSLSPLLSRLLGLELLLQLSRNLCTLPIEVQAFTLELLRSIIIIVRGTTTAMPG